MLVLALLVAVVKTVEVLNRESWEKPDAGGGLVSCSFSFFIRTQRNNTIAIKPLTKKDLVLDDFNQGFTC